MKQEKLKKRRNLRFRPFYNYLYYKLYILDCNNLLLFFTNFEKFHFPISILISQYLTRRRYLFINWKGDHHSSKTGKFIKRIELDHVIILAEASQLMDIWMETPQVNILITKTRSPKIFFLYFSQNNYFFFIFSTN